MTARLRELAGDWIAAADAHSEQGFPAAADVGRRCADELLSILDAEGDGGAVDRHDSDCATHNMPAFPNGECDCSLRGTEPAAWISHRRVVGLPDKDFYGKLPIQSLQPGFYSHTPLYTHPARSGVVMDEEARDVLVTAIAAEKKEWVGDFRIAAHEALRGALEKFDAARKGERHER